MFRQSLDTLVLIPDSAKNEVLYRESSGVTYQSLAYLTAIRKSESFSLGLDFFAAIVAKLYQNS